MNIPGNRPKFLSAVCFSIAAIVAQKNQISFIIATIWMLSSWLLSVIDQKCCSGREREPSTADDSQS